MADAPIQGVLRLNRFAVWLVICLSIFILPAGVAQGDTLPLAYAALSPPDTREFPRISAYLDVRDIQGGFVHGLDLAQVRALEDENPLPVDELEELRPGAQMVVAINPGRTFSIRDGQGLSRYDRLVQALRSWASGQTEAVQGNGPGDGRDDYSLVVTGGLEALHLEDRGEWLAALEGTQADFRALDAKLDVLLRAMQVASDAPPRPGMGRLVLFITPPPEGDFSAGMQALIERARAQGIRLYVWMVASPELFTSNGAGQLLELAQETGGTFFAYSGQEPVPNLEEFLAPMRSIYRLAYHSHIAAGGPHQIAAEIRLAGFAELDAASGKAQDQTSEGVATPPQPFEVNLLPPNPVFVEPPTEILRESSPEGQAGGPVLLPEEQTLEVSVEFPDGFQRQVVSMTLFVDGAPVLVISEPPFEQLSWDLSRYTEDATYRLRVEAVDSLGLRSSSGEFPVRIQVKYTPQNFLSILTHGGPLIAIFAVVFSGAVLALVLILGGRIQPYKMGQIAGRRTGWGRFLRRGRPDPLTQPVRGASMGAVEERSSEQKTIPAPGRGKANWKERLHLHARRVPLEAYASLARLVDDDGTTVPTPHPLTAAEVILGRDPSLSTLVIDDPSVESCHARLRLMDKKYRLSDEGSIAGTWVNFTPVSQEGVTLEHGDLIHIGRVGFRFLMRDPARDRKPVVNREDRPS